VARKAPLSSALIRMKYGLQKSKLVAARCNEKGEARKMIDSRFTQRCPQARDRAGRIYATRS